MSRNFMDRGPDPRDDIIIGEELGALPGSSMSDEDVARFAHTMGEIAALPLETDFDELMRKIEAGEPTGVFARAMTTDELDRLIAELY